MRLRRVFLPVLAGLLLPLVIPLSPREAVAQTEVDRAADEVARAAAERAEAQGLVEASAARRGTVVDQTMAALFELEQTNTHLETAAFEVLELREAIFQAEARVSRLRDITETRAVEAYMTGTVSEAFTVWSASNFEQSVLLEETAASAQRKDSLELANLASERDRLADLQGSYKRREAGLRVLREQAKDQGDALLELFAAVDADYVVSYQGLQQADADYQQAVSVAEAARRRRAARAGVEPWRTMVQQYFAGPLVEEALRVMSCESGGNPDAVHPGSDATGLFQFLAGTWAFSSVEAGFPGASRFDAEANVAAAAWLVDYSIKTDHPRGAWGHWVCQP